MQFNQCRQRLNFTVPSCILNQTEEKTLVLLVEYEKKISHVCL